LIIPKFGIKFNDILEPYQSFYLMVYYLFPFSVIRVFYLWFTQEKEIKIDIFIDKLLFFYAIFPNSNGQAANVDIGLKTIEDEFERWNMKMVVIKGRVWWRMRDIDLWRLFDHIFVSTI